MDSSKILYSTGKNDEWKTPRYAVEAIKKIHQTTEVLYGVHLTKKVKVNT